ncbi:MAG: hypothetical protein HY978_00645 [Candidatus Liptonbacteria bacterium]|nr:hypothetical protein [Candidatus Liptonbacteria bacterium]
MEDSFYSKWCIKSRDIGDCYGVLNSELMYECQESDTCSRCTHSQHLKGCVDCHFTFYCAGCQNCFMSSNLKNQQYVFYNERLTKQEYEKRVGSLNLGNHATLKKLQADYEVMLRKTLRKYSTSARIVNCTGDVLWDSKNVRRGFHLTACEDCAYCVDNDSLKDCYDAYEAAFNCERQYECHACNRTSYAVACSISYDNHHIYYCDMCHGSSDLWGCIGLRDKRHFILNQQYSPEKYDRLTAQIISEMSSRPFTDNRGRKYAYGDFFPVEHSPFAHNETVAEEYFPLTKGETLARSYQWKDPEEKGYQITIAAQDLPDRIQDVSDDILGQVIGCAHQTRINADSTRIDADRKIDENPRIDQSDSALECGHQCTTAFRLIPAELQFYRRLNLPLPRLCPNCRHSERIAQRNPLKLWHRRCQCDPSVPPLGKGRSGGVYQNTIEHSHGKEPCPNEFETSYAPDPRCAEGSGEASRPEIVYCESCYNAEVA